MNKLCLARISDFGFRISEVWSIRNPQFAIRNRGQVLIIVLWVMGVVTVAMGALTARATHELRLGWVPTEALERSAIAQAGVLRAVSLLQQDTQEAPQIDTLQEPWATGVDVANTPVFERIAVGDGSFSVGRWEGETFIPGLIDEERKLNLRFASADVLSRLIALRTPDEADPTQMANAIVEWRTSCDDADPPCSAPPFSTIDELRFVPGMTPELFNALEPYVTVYGSGTVNANTAMVEVLNALEPIAGYSGDAIVQQRTEQPFDEAHPPPAGLGIVSSAFTVPVEARLTRSSLRQSLRAVVDRNGTILAWQKLPIDTR